MGNESTATAVSRDQLTAAIQEGLSTILEEIFQDVHGFMLDKGDSFFETLADISAEEASRPVSTQSGSIAAQVNHTRYYIDVLLEFLRTREQPATDWDGSWRVGPVDDAAWQELVSGLEKAYQELQTVARNFDDWDALSLTGAFGTVGHCAYHLGEVRQGLGVLRS